MSAYKQQVLEEASLGDFLGAKTRAARESVGGWLERGRNFEKVLVGASAGLSAISAGAEIAANRLEEQEGIKGNLGRGALHAVTALSLGGAGATLALEGLLIGDKKS